jgi:hypothetical protein
MNNYNFLTRVLFEDGGQKCHPYIIEQHIIDINAEKQLS